MMMTMMNAANADLEENAVVVRLESDLNKPAQEEEKERNMLSQSQMTMTSTQSPRHGDENENEHENDRRGDGRPSSLSSSSLRRHDHNHVHDHDGGFSFLLTMTFVMTFMIVTFIGAPAYLFFDDSITDDTAAAWGRNNVASDESDATVTSSGSTSTLALLESDKAAEKNGVNDVFQNNEDEEQRRNKNVLRHVRQRRRKLQEVVVVQDQQEQEHVLMHHHSTDERRHQRSLLGLSSASLPPGLEFNVIDVMNLPDANALNAKETAVFWKHSHTGSSISAVPFLSDCLNLVTASHVGGHIEGDPDTYSQKLKVVTNPVNERRYVNVDVSTKEGLTTHKAYEIPSSGLVDVVISSHLKQLLGIFDSEYRARIFTILRHPVQRSVSHFYSLQRRGREPGATRDFQIFANMTLLEYAQSDYVDSNYLTRSLVNKPTGSLLATDLYLAKIILRQKFLIGLSDQMPQTLDRIHLYFPSFRSQRDHFRLGKWQLIRDCKAQYLHPTHISKAKHTHAEASDSDSVSKILHAKHWADVSLYDYAVEVWNQQGSALFPELVKNYRKAELQAVAALERVSATTSKKSADVAVVATSATSNHSASIVSQAQAPDQSNKSSVQGLKTSPGAEAVTFYSGSTTNSGMFQDPKTTELKSTTSSTSAAPTDGVAVPVTDAATTHHHSHHHHSHSHHHKTITVPLSTLMDKPQEQQSDNKDESLSSNSSSTITTTPTATAMVKPETKWVRM